MVRLLQSPSFELMWEPQQGFFRLQSPGRALEVIAGADFDQRGRMCVLTSDNLPPGRAAQSTLEDAHGQAEQASIHFQEAQGVSLKVCMRLYPSRPFALFRISITNVGPAPLNVRRFFVETLPDGLESIAEPTGFYVNGWQSWSPSGFILARRRDVTSSWPGRRLFEPVIRTGELPRLTKSGRLTSETVGAVITEREALVAGGASLADQFVQVIADLRPGHLGIVVQSQADDVPVDVGEALASEWFYLEWVPLPNSDPFAQYAYAVARQMAVPALRPPRTGWCSYAINSSEVSEADVIDNLAAAALLADEMPLQIIQLYEEYQTLWGDWTARNARFPHDLRWLGKRIRGSGFTPGLWVAPLTVHPKSVVAVDHPEWILRNERGRPVSPGSLPGCPGLALDATHPGVQDYVRSLIRQAVHEWGYPCLTLDFMYAGALPGQRHNVRMTRAQALRQMFRLIREAAGGDAYLVGSGTPLQPAIGLVDAVRVGPDSACTWDSGLGRIRRWLRKHPALPGVRDNVRNVLSRAWTHNRWWSNDPGALLLRRSQSALTTDEVLAQVTLVGLTGGSVWLSDDLESLLPERRAMVAALLPPLSEGMDTLDLYQNEMPEEVLVPVARSWGRWSLVGLFNWRNEPVERTLPAGLSLDPKKMYHMLDFWERRYLRLEPGSQSPVFHLPPHGAVLLGIRKVETGTHLVGTTFHISQGAEITEWEPDVNALSLNIALGRLAHGEVWLALPARPKAAFLNDKPLPENAVRTVASGVWAVSFYVNRTGTLRVNWIPK